MGQVLTPCNLEDALIFENRCIQCTKDLDRLSSRSTCLQYQKTGAPRISDSLSIHTETVINRKSNTIRSFKEDAFACCTSDHTELALNGKKLRIVTILRPPFVTTKEVREKDGESNNQFDGVIFAFLEAIQAKYNFSMKTRLPYDGNWGSKLANGSWNGMIGMITRNEADVGAASFSVTVERARVVAFTMAFHQEPTGILLPPPIEAEKLSVLVRPLSKQVWAALLITIFILVPTLYVFHRLSQQIQGDSRRYHMSCTSITSDLVWFITGSILQQGLISPVEKSTKFVTCIWWFMTLIIANIYVAFLVSYLSTPKLYNIVDDLESLSHQSKIKWTFRTNTAHRSLFKGEGSVGTYKIIGDKSMDSDLVSSDADGIAKVLTGKFAFIKEKSFLDVAIGQDFEKVRKCRMTLAKETFFTVGTALIVEKKSPYLNILNYEISNAIATGIMEKWKDQNWPRGLECTDAATYIISTRPKTRKLTLDDVQGAYFLLGTGIAFSITAFLIEHFNAKIACNLEYVIIYGKFFTAWKFLK